jgi:replicative DNA helicase Mcm
MDPDTGKIDIARVEGRTPTSERDKMRVVQEELKALEEEFDLVPVNILKEHLADNHDMSEEKTDEILRILRSKGIIYEPHHGVVKRLED